VQSYYTFIALDIARQRAHEAEQERLVQVARDSDDETGRGLRRSAAAFVAAVSRASERLARAIDENVIIPTH
jgi:homoserine kinase